MDTGKAVLTNRKGLTNKPMKLLTICPTRNRHPLLKQMTDSYHKTISDNDNKLVLCVDHDDSRLRYYEKYDAHTFYKNETVTEMINFCFNMHPDYDFYHVSNDDFVYHTKDWDISLTKKQGINYGNDLFMKHNQPVGYFIPKEFAKAVGWLQMPRLTHLYGDSVWKMIGHKLNRLYYHKDIVIEHRHFMNNKLPRDEIYDKTNSVDMYKRDSEAFHQWVVNDYVSDIAKIQEVINGKT